MHIEKDFKNKLTKKDYLTYLLTKNMILLLSPIVIIALLIAIVYSIIKDGFGISTVIYFLPIILFAASYIKIIQLIKHTLKAQKEIYELKVTLTDTEYKDLTNGETNSLSFDKVYCYKETKSYLYIFVDRYNALILPKREFNPTELKQINTTFSSKMKKSPMYDLSSWLMLFIVIALVALVVYKLIS